jgi:hypothetical protein
MASDIITIIANLALALSFIAALIFGIVQTQAAARDRRERFTLETLRNFQTREFAELIHYLNTHDMPSSLEELEALPENEQIIFIQLGQQMESLGMLVAEDFINIDLVDKTLGSFVSTAWRKYQVVLLDIRKKTPDPYLGEYFQWLAEQIDQRLKINPRKPFYKTEPPHAHNSIARN